MAAVTVILKKHYCAKGGNQIAIRIHHNDRTKYFKTGYNVPKENWDDKRSRVKGTHPLKDKINSVIQDMVAQAERYIAQCRVNQKPIQLDEIFDDQEEKVEGTADQTANFSWFLRKLCDELRMRGKPISARNLEKNVKHLEKWKGGEVTYNDLLADGALVDFERFCREELKHINNTRASNFATLQQKWNQAASRGFAPARNPFKAYKIQREKTKKERLTLEEVYALWNYKSTRPNRNLVRDMFLFSYFCRGIRLDNVLSLKKSDITKKEVHFVMVKSKKPAYEELNPWLLAIIDRYKDTPGPYLFPLLGDQEFDRSSIEWVKKKNSLGTNINNALRVILRELGIKKKITFHCARHTFAHLMLKQGAPAEAIKEALGHADISTTHRYMGELDNSVVIRHTKNLYTQQLYSGRTGT